MYQCHVSLPQWSPELLPQDLFHSWGHESLTPRWRALASGNRKKSCFEVS